MDILKRNNVQVIGSPQHPPMMFAHGFIGDQTLWRHVVEKFKDKYKVILFDYVGSGKSDASAYDSKKYSRLEGYAQDVLDICRTLELREVIFVAHSISAMVGLIAAVNQPQLFSRMIFVTPSPRFINDGKYYGGFEKEDIDGIIHKIEHNYTAWAHELIPVVVKKPDAPDVIEELIEKLISTDHMVAINFAKATFFTDYRKELLKLQVPSLILQCEEDLMAPLEVGDYLQAHLHDSTLKRLDVKGHFPHLSAPKVVVKAITQYLISNRKFK
jgi:sigma-B regulation protein RsbQ